MVKQDVKKCAIFLATQKPITYIHTNRIQPPQPVQSVGARGELPREIDCGLGDLDCACGFDRDFRRECVLGRRVLFCIDEW